jgi:hypothetical protein
MTWILATRGISTKLRSSPFTETAVDGASSLIYKVGIEPVPFSGADAPAGELGTFQRGLHRVAGYVFSYDGSVAETLFTITDEIDLIIRYRANRQVRKRTFADVLFIGDAIVAVPALNTGVSELIGVPFRVQIPDTDTLADHVVDALDT